MKKLIAGNWKMNTDGESARTLMQDLLKDIPTGVDLLVCPPFSYLEGIFWILKGKSIALGGQDCSDRDNGAFTGDISAKMLKGIGCTYVILGHSERRQHHRETDALIARKAAKAHENGLITIICVGETESQREAGEEKSVIEKQLGKAIPKSATPENTVIAYEPVWAIGTGKTAKPKDVRVMHNFIRKKLGARLKGCRILYGGSMKPENARELLATPNVDGGLIGGASLKAADFIAIAKSA
jgi:triosephosphate isomerase